MAGHPPDQGGFDALWFWAELEQPNILANRAVAINVRKWIEQYGSNGVSWREWQLKGARSLDTIVQLR